MSRSFKSNQVRYDGKFASVEFSSESVVNYKKKTDKYKRSQKSGAKQIQISDWDGE